MSVRTTLTKPGHRPEAGPQRTAGEGARPAASIPTPGAAGKRLRWAAGAGPRGAADGAGRGLVAALRRAELVSDPAAPPRVAPHLLPLPDPELRGYAAGAALGPGTPGCGQPSALPAAPKYR